MGDSRRGRWAVKGGADGRFKQEGWVSGRGIMGGTDGRFQERTDGRAVQAGRVGEWTKCDERERNGAGW